MELITKFTDMIKELGPLGEAEEISVDTLKRKLSVACSVAAGAKLRTQLARLTEDMREGNEYSTELIAAKMSEKLDETILRELERQEKLTAESGTK